MTSENTAFERELHSLLLSSESTTLGRRTPATWRSSFRFVRTVWPANEINTVKINRLPMVAVDLEREALLIPCAVDHDRPT